MRTRKSFDSAHLFNTQTSSTLTVCRNVLYMCGFCSATLPRTKDFVPQTHKILVATNQDDGFLPQGAFWRCCCGSAASPGGAPRSRSSLGAKPLHQPGVCGPKAFSDHYPRPHCPTLLLVCPTLVFGQHTPGQWKERRDEWRAQRGRGGAGRPRYHAAQVNAQHLDCFPPIAIGPVQEHADICAVGRAILDDALLHVPQHGWTIQAVIEGVKAQGLSPSAHGIFPRYELD